MIRLARISLPPEIEERLSEDEQRLCGLLHEGNDVKDIPESLKTKYSWPPLKAHLIHETSGKCAYCESELLHVSFGDVEHILSKDQHPDLTLDHENLTLACSRCNNAKSNYYDPNVPLLNPFYDEPTDHIFPWGSFIYGKPCSHRGKTTETVLQLNRKGLPEKRQERIEKLKCLADAYETSPEGPVKDGLGKQLRKEAEACREYSLIVRAWLRQLYPEVLEASVNSNS